MHYYNEIDPKCCALLRAHIDAGRLPAGYVDSRSIEDVMPEDLEGYTHCHFFAGIGGFPLGFFIADVPDGVRVWTGGFPCQDLSVAGQRAGLAGGRSSLWFEFHRLIASCKPEWVVIENVPGLLSAHAGRDFAVLLGGLTGVIPEVPADGWGNAGFVRGPLGTAAHRVLDAQYAGVAQRRRRVFIVTGFGEQRHRACQILFERESSQWDPPPSREAGQGTARDSRQSFTTTGRGFWREGLPTETARQWKDGGNGLVAYGGNNTSGPIDIATACNAHGSRRYDFESETFVASPLQASLGHHGHSSPRGDGSDNLIAFDTTQITSPGNYSHPKSGDPCHPLASGAHPPAVAFTERTRADGRNLETQEELSYALTNPGKGGRTQERCIAFQQDATDKFSEGIAPTMRGKSNGGTRAYGVAGAWGVRRLTCEECEKLQGFPPGWTAVLGERATRIDDETIQYLRCQYCRAYGVVLSDEEVKLIQSDSARYKQLGNAVCVNVIEWIGRRLKAVAGRFKVESLDKAT